MNFPGDTIYLDYCSYCGEQLTLSAPMPFGVLAVHAGCIDKVLEKEKQAIKNI